MLPLPTTTPPAVAGPSPTTVVGLAAGVLRPSGFAEFYRVIRVKFSKNHTSQMVTLIASAPLVPRAPAYVLLARMPVSAAGK